MRLLGIDYGEKRVGIALTDDKSLLAFPHSVVPNTKNLLRDVAEIARRSNIETIVIGESKNNQGKDNRIMDEIRPFAVEIAKLGYNVVFEPEFLTSHQASHFLGKTAKTDASAASIILQSYIDRIRHQGMNDRLF